MKSVFFNQILRLFLFVGFIGTLFTSFDATAQSFRRKNIVTDYTPDERLQLRNLMMGFITSTASNNFPNTYLGNPNSYNAIQLHANANAVSGLLVHGSSGTTNFLPWHRLFIKDLEDYLLTQPGGDYFVPLPKWSPNTQIPCEFFNNEATPSTGTPCTTYTVTATPGTSSVANGSINQKGPFNTPSFMTLENNPCSFGTLNSFETTTESLHNNIHGSIGGVMGAVPTASGAAIFYLWHAYIDDLYWNYQCTCGDNTKPDEGTSMNDLFIRGTNDDYGVEPYVNSNPNQNWIWNSPDIWVRETTDILISPGHYQEEANGSRHQNPKYSVPPNATPNYIYVKVKNRSCEPIPAGAKVRVYFSKASTGLTFTPNTWENYYAGTSVLHGDEITTGGGISLPAIPANGTYTIEVPWLAPNPNDFTGGDRHHFCLRAEIESAIDPITPNPNFVTYVVNNNNVAWKNVSISNTPFARLVNGTIIGNVFVPNMSNTPRKFRIHLKPIANQKLDGLGITHTGQITAQFNNLAPFIVGTSPNVIVGAGGAIKLPSDSLPVGDGVNQTPVEELAAWVDVLLPANHHQIVGLHFQTGGEFTERFGNQDWEFDFNMIQNEVLADGNEQFVGGETFTLRTNYPCKKADAGTDKVVPSGSCVTIGTPALCPTCTYTWTKSGVVVGNTAELQICPTANGTYSLSVYNAESGCNFTDEVRVYVNRICTALIGPANFSVQTGQCVELGSATTNCPDCTYTWSPAAGLSNPNISNPVACPTQSTTYTLVVQTANPAVCYRQTNVNVQVIDCNAAAQAGADVTINAGQCVTIGTVSPSFETMMYHWGPHDGLISDHTSDQVVVCPTQTTTYTVEVHDMNGCFTPAIDQVTVFVNQPNFCNATAQAATVTGNYYLKTVQIGTNRKISSNGGGYSNYTATIWNLSKGITYPITITPSRVPRTPTATIGYCVWIDYNHDKDFSDPGEQVLSQLLPNTAIARANLIIPTTALGGQCRMRVCMKVGGLPTSCGVFEDGEVEDYTINIPSNATILGIINTSDLMTLTLYPNPTTGLITLQGIEDIKTVSIFDMMGKQLLQTTTNGDTQLEIDLTQYPAGMYFLKTDNGQVQKIVKQ